MLDNYLQDFTKTEACDLNSSEVKTSPFEQLTLRILSTAMINFIIKLLNGMF